VEKLIEQIARLPIGVKVGVVAGALVLITALNYFAFGVNMGDSITSIEESIRRTQSQQAQLDKDFIEKTAIANNLNQFRREKELLEQQLREALAELPEDKKIDELLQLFQDRAQKAGLDIGTIEPGKVTNERFYAKIPIPMTVTGNFHEIATFFDSLGRMRRIVNVTDIVFSEPKDVNGKVILSAKFLATTFMFVEPGKDAGAKPGAKPGARPAGGPT
jgi:type IV pilus assembly protein PilO